MLYYVAVSSFSFHSLLDTSKHRSTTEMLPYYPITHTYFYRLLLEKTTIEPSFFASTHRCQPEQFTRLSSVLEFVATMLDYSPTKKHRTTRPEN